MFIGQAIGVPVLVAIGFTIAIAGSGLTWLVRAVGSATWTDEHAVAVVSGILLFWAVLAVFDELSGHTGMSIVAVASVVGLVRLRRRVRARGHAHQSVPSS